MNEALATTAQQEEDITVTTTIPKLEGSQVIDALDSPDHHTGTPPPQLPPLLDIPFVESPQVGHPFAGFIVDPMEKKLDCSLSGTPGDLQYKWTHVNSQEAEVRSEYCSIQGEEDMPTLALEAGPSSEPQG